MSYLYSNFVSTLTSTRAPSSGYDLISVLSGSGKSGVLYLGNLLIQWGTTGNYYPGGHNIDFNVSYDASSDYTVIGGPGSNSYQDETGILINNSENTSSTFKLHVWSTTSNYTMGVNWIAIGKKPS